MCLSNLVITACFSGKNSTYLENQILKLMLQGCHGQGKTFFSRSGNCQGILYEVGGKLKSTSLSEKSKSFIFGWPPGWETGEVMLFQKAFIKELINFCSCITAFIGHQILWSLTTGFWLVRSQGIFYHPVKW